MMGTSKHQIHAHVLVAVLLTTSYMKQGALAFGGNARSSVRKHRKIDVANFLSMHSQVLSDIASPQDTWGWADRSQYMYKHAPTSTPPANVQLPTYNGVHVQKATKTSWITIYKTFFCSPIYMGLISLVATRLLGISSVSLDPHVIVAVCSGVYGVYAYDRVKDANDLKCSSASERSRFISQHQSEVWTSVVLAVLTLGYCAGHLSWTTRSLLAFCATLGYGYTKTIFPGGYSLRTAPAGKTVTVSMLYVLAGVLIPLSDLGVLGNVDPLRLGAVGSHILLIMGQASIHNDLRDIEEDAMDGTLSIPVLLGTSKTLDLIQIACILDGIFQFAVFKNQLMLMSNAIVFILAMMSRDGSNYYKKFMWAEASLLLSLF